MKEYLCQLVRSKDQPKQKLNIIREYLQYYILSILQKENIFQNASFMGGTALRFLYEIPRFSEDLDFSLSDHHLYFVELITKLKRELTLAGYNLEIKYTDNKAVLTAFIKFESLLSEAGVSNNPKQRFIVKLEIDTQVPQGARLETTIVYKYIPISITHYDLSSLFAGKLNALMTRPYAKGRDYFDLSWYLMKWKDLEPNFELLNNSLLQFNHSLANQITPENWRGVAIEIVDRQDWQLIVSDVAHLIEDEHMLSLFTKENTIGLLKNSD